MIGYKISHQFYNQWEAKPKESHLVGNIFTVLSELQVIARNSDWFITLFAPVVIRQSYYFGIGFHQSFENCSDGFLFSHPCTSHIIINFMSLFV